MELGKYRSAASKDGPLPRLAGFQENLAQLDSHQAVFSAMRCGADPIFMIFTHSPRRRR